MTACTHVFLEHGRGSLKDTVCEPRRSVADSSCHAVQRGPHDAVAWSITIAKICVYPSPPSCSSPWQRSQDPRAHAHSAMQAYDQHRRFSDNGFKYSLFAAVPMPAQRHGRLKPLLHPNNPAVPLMSCRNNGRSEAKCNSLASTSRGSRCPCPLV
jgi:hypothetical protein